MNDEPELHEIEIMVWKSFAIMIGLSLAIMGTIAAAIHAIT